MRRDSDSLCCQTHGWFTVEHGVDALGREWCDDGTCPECGEYPEAPIDPDDVTTAAPGLDDWIGNNAPQCQDCEESAEFVLPADRKPGEERLRWKCQVHGWVDNTGHVIPTGEKVAE
jgi:hypothetical protein